MTNENRRKSIEKENIKSTNVKRKKFQMIGSLISLIIAIFCVWQVVIMAKYTFGKSVNEKSLWLYRAFQIEERGDN